MKIAITFRYIENEIPPRCRKARDVKHEGALEVEIRQATSREAPIALRETARRWNYSTKTWEERHFVHRWYGGHLWSNHFINSDREPIPETPECPDRVYCYSKSRTGLEVAHQEIQEWADRHLMIDGQHWLRVPEPIYWISHTVERGQEYPERIGIIKVAWDRRDTYNCTNWDIFRIDQLGEAKAQAETKFSSGKADRFRILNEFEILIPEAVQRQPQREALEIARTQLQKNFQDFLDSRDRWDFNRDRDRMRRETAKVLHDWLKRNSTSS